MKGAFPKMSHLIYALELDVAKCRKVFVFISKQYVDRCEPWPISLW